MRRAFTLLELMVVVGIMAFLGIASANSYNALRRGMEGRSAIEATSRFLVAAKERAQIDCVPTAVFFWNRCIREATSDSDAIVVGEAVAVRRSGRITWVDGKSLYDEFGDLNRSYDADDTAGNLDKRKGFRLWYMSDGQAATPQMRYSIVADGVFSGKEAKGTSFMPLADGDVQNISSNIDIRACAFYKLDDGTFSGWKVGMAYGMEFQRLRLPDGYIFGRSVSAETVGTIQQVAQRGFIPGQLSTGGQVDISFCVAGEDGKPQVSRYVGYATGDENTEAN